MLRREAREYPVEGIAVGVTGSAVIAPWRDELVDVDLDHSAATPTGFVDRGVDEQSVQPGVEAIAVAEIRQVAPGPNQGFLDGVTRELGIPQDQAGRRVQARPRCADERTEGLSIAVGRPVHEPALLHIALASLRHFEAAAKTMATAPLNR